MTSTMFQKRHYEAIAELFTRIDSGAPKHVYAEAFADLFGYDNPRFSRSRFFKACGVGND